MVNKFMTEPVRSVGLNPNKGGRDLAVGDVHGCFSKLTKALWNVGFNPKVDRLFCVGDLVDRGPESADILDWLAKPWLFTICGNHEFLAFRAALDSPYPNVLHERVGGGWLAGVSPEKRLAVGRALAALPLAQEVETKSGRVGLVHADCPFDDWSLMKNKEQWWQSDAEVGSFYDLCLWSTERFDRCYEGVVKNVKAVVHGHMVVKKRAVMGNAHFIDTGGWLSDGRFTLLDLETMKPARAKSF